MVIRAYCFEFFIRRLRLGYRFNGFMLLPENHSLVVPCVLPPPTLRRHLSI